MVSINDLVNSAKSSLQLGDYVSCVQSIEQAKKKDPKYPFLDLYLGQAYHNLGLGEYAFKIFWDAYQQNQIKEYLLNAILAAHHHTQLGPQNFHDLALMYYSKHVKPNVEAPLTLKPRNNTKIKLGFVSKDFFHHPVITNLYNLFSHLDREKFEIYCYHCGTVEDAWTQSIRDISDGFVSVADLAVKQAAELINNDLIDIVFEISGIFNSKFLELFAYKPAPIAITTMGYWGTLGIAEIDFILADKFVLPENETKFFVEKPLYLPHSFCQGSPYQMPDLASARTQSQIAFGSMNKTYKLSPAVIQTWSQILKEQSNSKLILDASSFQSIKTRNYFSNLFREAGIDLERIEFRASLQRETYLQTLYDIDIALDPFPFGGGTSSLENLFMGLPVITQYADRWCGRQTSSFLHTLGHSELIATDNQDYITRAINLSQNPNQILKYKQSLRNRILESALEPKHYVEDLSELLLSKSYCS